MFGKRLELLADLWKPQLEGTQLEALSAILLECKAVNELRNIIIHGEWVRPDIAFGLDLARGVYGRKKGPAKEIKQRMRSEPAEHSSTEILQVAHQFHSATEKLGKFAEEGSHPLIESRGLLFQTLDLPPLDLGAAMYANTPLPLRSAGGHGHSNPDT